MKLVKPGAEHEVPRGILGGSEISQSTTGAQNIYMAVFRVPPGAQSRPHYHENCESTAYMLSGSMRVKWGDHLEQKLLELLTHGVETKFVAHGLVAPCADFLTPTTVASCQPLSNLPGSITPTEKIFTPRTPWLGPWITTASTPQRKK